MLRNLYVKNLALIDEVNIDLDEGLTVLTGETGAGKSIILGAVSLALGMKAPSDLVRDESKEAVAQLGFYFDDKDLIKHLQNLDINIDDDGDLIIKRIFSGGRSRFKINGCDISAAQVKEIAPFLLDLHAQRDNLRLLKEKEQLKLIDSFADEDLKELLSELSTSLSQANVTRSKLEGMSRDENSRQRELDLLRFEANELESAALKPGEDEELEAEFTKGENSEKIKEGAYTALEALSGDEGSVNQLLSSAIKSVENIVSLSEDKDIINIKNMLYDADSIVNDALRELSTYADNTDVNEEEFAFVTERINIYNKLKDKYKTDTKGLLLLLEEKQERMAELENFSERVREYESELARLTEDMKAKCKVITEKRKKAAAILEEKIVSAAKDLNFNDIKFSVDIESTGEPNSSGDNKVCFMISLNPGEALKSLSQVASGGELSRIMLAFKTISADTDGTETLIFDEIDTGISGRTAQMVAAKMANVAKNHQIICITHLPQIAAMGEHHFLITKSVSDNKSITDIRELSNDERTDELSRLLGGDKITETVKKNASEMIRLADEYRKKSLF